MSHKKKIAFFSFALDHGGAEKVISLISGEMTKYYDVYVILFYRHVYFEVSDKVKIISIFDDHITYKESFLKKFIDFFKAIKRYSRLMKKLEIDISISFLTVPNFINSIVKIFNKNLITIVSERNYPSTRYKEKKHAFWIAKKFIPVFYNQNDLVFSNSIHINEDLIKNFSLKAKTAVIYNPVKLRETPISLKFESNQFHLVNVARLANPKNQELLVKTMTQLDDDIKLCIMGDGDRKDYLTQLAENLNLKSRITFHGTITDVKNKLENYDCFVLSSNIEGFPNALLEAMSVGLPVISTNCISGPLELLNDNAPTDIPKGEFYRAKFGILVSVNDVDGMKNAINYFKNNPTERSHYAKLAYERAKNYSLENIGKELFKVIEQTTRNSSC